MQWTISIKYCRMSRTVLSKYVFTKPGFTTGEEE